MNAEMTLDEAWAAAEAALPEGWTFWEVSGCPEIEYGGVVSEAHVFARVRKMGPLNLAWDVEMPGYARIQVRKYLNPESLRKIAAELNRIGSGAEMPGYVWIQPGRGGERLIVFRLADYAERHGDGS